LLSGRQFGEVYYGKNCYAAAAAGISILVWSVIIVIEVVRVLRTTQ